MNAFVYDRLVDDRLGLVDLGLCLFQFGREILNVKRCPLRHCSEPEILWKVLDDLVVKGLGIVPETH